MRHLGLLISKFLGSKKITWDSCTPPFPPILGKAVCVFWGASAQAGLFQLFHSASQLCSLILY